MSESDSKMQTLDQKLLRTLIHTLLASVNDRIAYWDRINGPETAI